jgi:hypothetical protein
MSDMAMIDRECPRTNAAALSRRKQGFEFPWKRRSGTRSANAADVLFPSHDLLQSDWSPSRSHRSAAPRPVGRLRERAPGAASIFVRRSARRSRSTWVVMKARATDSVAARSRLEAPNSVPREIARAPGNHSRAADSVPRTGHAEDPASSDKRSRHEGCKSQDPPQARSSR